MSAEMSAAQHLNGRAAEIAKLTVYHVARMVFTEIPLSGNDLERRSDSKTFETADRAVIEETRARISAAAFAPTTAVCDARWSLIFSDAAGARLHSFWLDKFGTTGVHDGSPIELADERFIEWLREQYGDDDVLA